MKIVRLILSLLFILAGVLVALLSFLTYSNPKVSKATVSLEKVVPGVGDMAPILAEPVPLWGAWAGAAALMLLVAAWVWPKSLFKEMRMRKKIKKQAAAGGVSPVAFEGSGLAAVAPIPAAPSPSSPALSRQMDATPGAAAPRGLAVQQSASEADMIQELVNKEQLNMTGEVARQIIERAYPQLAVIIPLFYNDDSMVTFSRQIIAVLRNKFKLQDKEMSSYQFAQFQEKVYQLEEDKLFYQYTPQDRSRLDQAQQASVGKIFDQRTYQTTQQHLRGSREDWVRLSLKTAGSEAMDYARR